MKYLVMECRPDYAVLLDSEGRFWKAANLHYQVGETVEDPVRMRPPAPSGVRLRRIWAGAAALAACVMLVLGLRLYQGYSTVYSSVYLYINPEVRLDLNEKGIVVELEGRNEDGRRLLEGYRGKGKDKVTVSDELIDRAIEMGFLSAGGRVVISLDTPDEALFQEYGMELRTAVSEHLSGRLEVELQVVPFQNGGEEAEPTVPETRPAETAAETRPTQTAAPETQAPETQAPETRPPETRPEPSTTAPMREEGDSSYGDSAYGGGQSGEGGSPYDPPEEDPPEENDSRYEEQAAGDSGYAEEPEENGASFYEEEPEENGDSGYAEEPEENGSGEGDSSYEEDD